MSNRTIKVNTNNLSRDAKEVYDLISQARVNLKSMYSAMTELDSMWDGPANEAFMKQFNNDYDTFNSLCNYFEKAVSQMENAAEKYNSCENNVYQTIAKINI